MRRRTLSRRRGGRRVARRSFKRAVRGQKRRNRRFNSYRLARGGIRL